MATRINPTIGRVVWFHPATGSSARCHPDDEGVVTHAATVAHVNDDGTLNLSAVDSAGQQYAVSNVPLLQGDDVCSEGDAWAEWMPYQLAQAELESSKKK